MKVSIVCFWLLCLSFPLQATERIKLENEISDIFGFEETVEHYFIEYKKQILKLYPKLTDEYVESNFNSAFRYGKKRYMESYMKGLSVYTDEDLKELINYYRSDEGKWVIEKNLESNSIVRDDLVIAYDDFNRVLIEDIESQK